MIKRFAVLALLGFMGTGPSQAQDITLFEALTMAEHVNHHDPRTIRTIQRNLAYYSYYAGPIDGIWGPQTQLAVDLANRAERPHLYQVVEHEGGEATLIPLAAAVSFVPSDSYITLPHMNRVVPAYFHVEGQGTVWLDVSRRTNDTAQRYRTTFVDRADGYRTISPTMRVPVVAN